MADETENKKPRGFGAMPVELRKRLASMGGKAAHAAGTAHVWTPEEAKKAGAKGGAAYSRNKREHESQRDLFVEKQKGERS